MDWAAIIAMLLQTILPLIINKGPAVAKPALQRRAVRYARLSEAATDVESAFALGELASLCECLAAAETQAEQQQLLGAAKDGMTRLAAQLEG